MKNLSDAQLTRYATYFSIQMQKERATLKARIYSLFNKESPKHKRLGDQYMNIWDEQARRILLSSNQVQYAQGSVVGGEMRLDLKEPIHVVLRQN